MIVLDRRAPEAAPSAADAPHPADVTLVLGLAVLTTLLGFEAGGYFADTQGWAAAGLAVALGAVALARGRPPRGLTVPLLVAASALALFGLWTLLSAEWSGAWGRSLIEFDRVLLYLLALLLFAAAPSPRWTLRWIPAAVALAALVLCGSGLFIRTLPNSWPFDLPPVSSRMDYPLGYENALGALCGLGFVFALHLASWQGRHLIIRVLSAATLPVLASALVLTFSRGALAATAVGVVAYLILGLSRGAVTAVLAAAIPVVLAANGAYDADLLGSTLSRSPGALSQGEDLAILVAWTAAVAGVLHAGLIGLESRLPAVRTPRARPRVLVFIAALLAAAGVAVAVAMGGSGALSDLRDRVVGDSGGTDRPPADRRARDRLAGLDTRSQSRPKYWRVSVDAFGEHPLRGTGADTFPKLWARDRPITEDVTEGHSLYLETLAELGLVGAALLLVALGTILMPFVVGLRGPPRQLNAAFVAAGATWLVHAGLDWDWEMPVLCLWLFAAGGCALAMSPRRLHVRALRTWPARLAFVAACVVVALTPASVALSQSELDSAIKAFGTGDCEASDRDAHDAISAVPGRAEAYELLAYCSARRGDGRAAVRLMREAIDRDPDNWELVYGLSIVRGASGLDPRPAARRALRLNPRDDLTNDIAQRFATRNRAVWRRKARSAPLPLLLEEK